MWKESCKDTMADIKIVTEGDMRLFALLYEQCSPDMQTRPKGTPGYKTIQINQRGIEILSCI